MQLSVLCPGIRTNNWLKLYDSISESFSGTFEIIFIGPYKLPEELRNKGSVRYIYSLGSPIRCQQMGLLSSEGEYITWAADDGVFLPKSLDVAFSKIERNSVVMGKYYEGNNDGDMPMQEDKYYILSNHDATKVKWINKEYYMLNVGIVERKLLLEMGGWDAENFQVCPMAYNDFAIRLQRKGIKFIIQNEMMFKCSHMPGHEGDHGPIHDAQIEFDQPRFRNIYWDPKCVNRINIDIDNWKKSPERWIRRFGNSAA